MDGERRWSSALDLGLSTVPVRLIERPSPLDNLLRMFNIHAVREDWPLVSIALSLAEVIELSGETGETRLAERTGLSRSTVRRAKRLLSLPGEELDRIQAEAHLDRANQVHREDLYLEIERAESVIRREFPEIAGAFDRPQIIRQFVRKREIGSLTAVTEFRAISKIVAAVRAGSLDRRAATSGISRLISDESLSPLALFNDIAGEAYQQQGILRRSALLRSELQVIDDGSDVPESVREALADLEREINRLLGN
jgi:ParB-like chromosome segregation protein Spo0J